MLIEMRSSSRAEDHLDLPTSSYTFDLPTDAIDSVHGRSPARLGSEGPLPPGDVFWAEVRGEGGYGFRGGQPGDGVGGGLAVGYVFGMQDGDVGREGG